MKFSAIQISFLITVAFLQQPFLGYSQNGFKEQFLKADELLYEQRYTAALPIWEELLKASPDNANLQYKVGLCYVHMPFGRAKAVTKLEGVLDKIANNYDPVSTNEKNAPVDARYYLAKAYHLTYEIDKAKAEFTTFVESVNENHFLFKDAKRQIEMCNNAAWAVRSPGSIELNNLGEKINSPYPEYSPVISIDEEVIYFTSRRLRKDSSNVNTIDNETGGYFEDIYFAEKDADGNWGTPTLVDSVNTDGHDATVNLSSDGQTMFIYRDDDGDGNLYVSEKKGDVWTLPLPLGSDINGNKSQESHVAISADGNTLYYVSDRKGGRGGKDIWYCNKLPNGDWALSQKLRGNVNTVYDEDAVFLHPDGQTMYFASKGHSSIGGYDLFVSKWNKEDEVWGAPLNVGYPVNSTDDDIYLVTTPDGKRAYVSAFHEKNGYGEKDLYLMEMPSVEEKELTLMVGRIKVLNKETLPENAKIIITDATDNSTVGIYKPHKKSGRYSIILLPGNKYKLRYEADEYSHEEELFIPIGSGYQVINRGIDLKPVVFGTDIEEPKVVTKDTDADGVLDPEDKCPETPGTKENNGCPEIAKEEQEIINTAFEALEFETSKDVIKDESKPSLDTLAMLLTVKRPQWKLRLAGHTDDVGSSSANLRLSKLRANATGQYLNMRGVEMSRIIIEYYGESKPVADNKTAEGRQRNRRVEMEIVF